MKASFRRLLGCMVVLKLKSLTASFTNCQAEAGKGGTACPFNGGNMPHAGNFPS